MISPLGALVLISGLGPTPVERVGDDPNNLISPGLAGFIATFFIAVAVVVLVRSMTKHLRNVRYGPGGPDGPPAHDEGKGDVGA